MAVNDALGTAKIGVALDLTDFTAQVATGKSKMDGFGSAAEAAFNQSNARAKTAAQSLGRYIELIGKSADEAKVLRAQWAGINPGVLDPMITKLQKIRDEEAATAQVTAILADSQAKMQQRVKEARKELELFARQEEQLKAQHAAVRAAQPDRDREAAANTAAAAQRNFNNAIRNTAQYSGEYGERVDRMRQAVAAFTTQTYKQDTALQAVNRRLQQGGIEFNKYGLSAKQQTAALRQVPAQITDIFVSLQGGQNPLTVLLQQGGQLKDVFGGVRPALAGLASGLAGLINPTTLLLGATAAMGAAYLGAENRQFAFQKSLILTGSQSGLTADRLNEMTAALDAMSGINANKAAAALAQITATGKISVEVAQDVAQAALQMQRVTGKATAETIAEYAEIARDPVNAVLRLNEAEGFLTVSLFERIRALQDSGQIEEAAAVAQAARAAEQIRRTNELTAAMGPLRSAWYSLTQLPGEAWGAAVNYFDRVDQRVGESISTLQRWASALRISGPGGMFAMQAALNPPAAVPAAGGETPAQKAAKSAALSQLRAIQDGNRAMGDRQKLEEQQIINLNKALGYSRESAKVQQELAASRKAYEASKPKGKDGSGAARSLANAESKAILQGFKDQEDTQRAAITNTTKLLEAQYAARLVTTQDYYAKTRELTTQDFAAQESSLQRQIAALRARNVSGKDSVDTMREVGELEARLAKLRAEHATTLAILKIKEDDVTAARLRGVAAYERSLITSNEALKQQQAAAVARLSMGSQEAELQEKLADITAKTAEQQRQLAAEFAENNDKEAYDAKVKILDDAMREQVKIVRDGYAEMRAAEGEWINGLKGGMAEWMQNAGNTASQVNAITTKSLDGVTDAFVELATTGKMSWKSLLADIGKEIVRFMAKKAIMQFIQYFASAMGGGGQSSAISNGFDFNMGGGGGFQYAAKGAAFPGGAGLSAYSGSIVTKATPFAFAKGAGIMGEAGWEGIFPLGRDSSGRLGVRAMGMEAAGRAASSVLVQIITNIDKSGGSTTETRSEGDENAAYGRFAENMRGIAQQEISRSRMPGGQLWKAGVS